MLLSVARDTNEAKHWKNRPDLDLGGASLKTSRVNLANRGTDVHSDSLRYKHPSRPRAHAVEDCQDSRAPSMVPLRTVYSNMGYFGFAKPSIVIHCSSVSSSMPRIPPDSRGPLRHPLLYSGCVDALPRRAMRRIVD